MPPASTLGVMLGVAAENDKLVVPASNADPGEVEITVPVPPP